VTPEVSELTDRIEFRFSHHGNADFEVAMVRLRVAGELVQPADNRERPRRQAGFLLPLRMLSAIGGASTSIGDHADLNYRTGAFAAPLAKNTHDPATRERDRRPSVTLM
jgi:hypothetical protein